MMADYNTNGYYMGDSKNREHARTIEMVDQIVKENGLLMALHFLADCQTTNDDLRNMTKIIESSPRLKATYLKLPLT